MHPFDMTLKATGIHQTANCLVPGEREQTSRITRCRVGCKVIQLNSTAQCRAQLQSYILHTWAQHFMYKLLSCFYFSVYREQCLQCLCSQN